MILLLISLLAGWHLELVGGPSPRISSAAYDVARDRVVLFGGYGYDTIGGDGNPACSHRADTWEWDGVSWSELVTAHAPSPRVEHQMAYLAASPGVDAGVYLYGGRTNPVAYDDLWRCDGVDWHREALGGPPKLSAFGMAADPVRHRLVVYGGLVDAGSYSDQTWEWNGATWLYRGAGGAPGLRSYHAMAWDGTRVLLFGGYRYWPPPYGFLGDTWAWDGLTWTQLSASWPGLDARYGMALASKPAGKALLFGGWYGAFFGDAWSRQLGAWAEVGRGPSPRFFAAMAWDGQRWVLFGGSEHGAPDYEGDTWTWSEAPL